MKLIFYKAEQDADGRTVARRVVTIEDRESRPTGLGAKAPARYDRLSYWREFADFFEIV
jgi:hypothetical protein